jgi:ParB/RepB/Spo0J family partition protein
MSKKPAAKKTSAKKPAAAAEPVIEQVIAQDFGDSVIESIDIAKIDNPPKGEEVRPFNPQDPEYLRKVEYARGNKKWLHPIIVRKGENGRFIRVAGRNRLEASREVGWSQIEARIFADLDPATALEIGLIENLRSKDMTKTEIATAVAAIMRRRPGATVSGLAKEMNCTPNTVRNILSLNNLVTEAQRLVGKGEIPAANAYALALLPEDVQAENDGEWIKSAKNTKTLKFVKAVQEFVKDLKGDKTGTARKSSAERARNASKAQKPLTQTELETYLGDARTGDPKIIGAVNESFQDGMIDGLLIALGRKPLLPATRVAGYQPKPATSRAE